MPEKFLYYSGYSLLKKSCTRITPIVTNSNRNRITQILSVLIIRVIKTRVICACSRNLWQKILILVP
ncbi:hypothetical protein SAMN05192550_1285 [Flavobacterium glycines]|uniref:Uncharacterized protein n=1 Tax=Flavobacterium glycines TaxID=551990 RepID=A0A1G8PWK9_9FLAO|nr:hypothetical protein SAMN05192550_1285 [Flavobacterium glycines]